MIHLLSDREKEVLHYVARGMHNQSIAQVMNLSSETVKSYVFRIYGKIGAPEGKKARTFAASLYWENQ